MALSTFSSSTITDLLGLPQGTGVNVVGSTQMLATSNSSLAGFESLDTGSFLIMSSGIAADVTSSNSSGGQGTDLGEDGA